MTRALIVKTSSMGDILHALPAVSDAKKANPDLIFDWVVEKPFQEIPQWHPAVERIIPCDLRQWRGNIYQSFKNGQLQGFYRNLRKYHYDYVIDAQLAIKSAMIAKLARGPSHGGDQHSVRETMAARLYNHRHRVILQQHAVLRLRKLFAQSLGYLYRADFPDYQINNAIPENTPWQSDKPFVIAVHNATWLTKTWPIAYWRELNQWLVQQGLAVALPWGNEQEKATAYELAQDDPNIHVLPKMNLTQIAQLLRQAQAVVSCDTGLAHLAAALGVPNITMYGPTDPQRIGTYGANQRQLSAEFACAPCYQRQCSYPLSSSQKPACFTTIPPEDVIAQLRSLIAI